MADPDAVNDSKGEWFEVYASADVDLNGLLIGTLTPDEKLETSKCLRVAANSYAVFARETDPLVNGGLSNVLSSFTFALVNSVSSGIVIGSSNGTDVTVLHSVTYSSATKGKSTALDPSCLGGACELWCDGDMAYGDGDLGTPGMENSTCTSE